MLICPIWALTASSSRWQRRGILWPWAGMLILCVVVPGLLRAHGYTWTLWLRHVCVAGEFLLAVLLAVSLYERVLRAPAKSEKPAGMTSTARRGAIQ